MAEAGTMEEKDEQIKEKDALIADLHKENDALLEELKQAEKYKWKYKTERDNLRVDFNAMFFKDRNKIVTVEYGREIMIYLTTRYAAVKEAERVNKAAGLTEYPIKYETSLKKLQKLFAITEYRAQKTIDFLTATGAWRWPKTIIKPDASYKQKTYKPGEKISRGEKVVIYEIGERKRSKEKYMLPDGFYTYSYSTSFFFNLYQRTKVKEFYKRERTPKS